MAAKQLQFDESARHTLLRGVEKLAKAVKAKLVSAVSIGFTIDKYEILKSGGYQINEWEWLELSLVTIPANADATIHTIRSLDAEMLAASGHEQNGNGRVLSAGVTAPATPVVKAKEAKRMAKKTLAETISAFEATRAAKAAQRDEIMEKSAESGETFDAAQTEEYDGLVGEIECPFQVVRHDGDRRRATKNPDVPCTCGSVSTNSGRDGWRNGGHSAPRSSTLRPDASTTRSHSSAFSVQTE